MDNIESELTCAVCLDLLTDPRQYPCGHSYCLDCMNGLRAQQCYECPECRSPFLESESIGKNIKLSNLVEAYRQSGNVRIKRQATTRLFKGGQDHAAFLIIFLLLLIGVYAVVRLQRAEQLLQHSKHLVDSSQAGHEDGAWSDPMDAMQWPWLLLKGACLCVWWLISCLVSLLPSLLGLLLQCLWLLLQGLWFIVSAVCSTLFNAVLCVCVVTMLYALVRV